VGRVGVDQGTVDVEDHSVQGHGSKLGGKRERGKGGRVGKTGMTGRAGRTQKLLIPSAARDLLRKHLKQVE